MNQEAERTHLTARDTEKRRTPPQVIRKALRRNKAKLVGAGVLLAILGVARWFTLPQEGRYLFPNSPEDWTAWGTWFGALGAVGAVIFAALSVGQAFEEQEQNRIDRDARNAREEVERSNQGEMQRRKAEKLTFIVGTYRLGDGGYLGPEADAHKEKNRKQESWLEEQTREDYDNTVCDRIYVQVSNNSTDETFYDLTLSLFEERTRASIVAYEHRDTPPPWDGFSPRESDYPPEWKTSDYKSVHAAEENRWMVGSLEPRRQLRVTLQFDSEQPSSRWEEIFRDDQFKNQNPGNLVLKFRDASDRCWIRSTSSIDLVRDL